MVSLCGIQFTCDKSTKTISALYPGSMRPATPSSPRHFAPPSVAAWNASLVVIHCSNFGHRTFDASDARSRSEERRVGKECVATCRSFVWSHPLKQTLFNPLHPLDLYFYIF